MDDKITDMITAFIDIIKDVAEEFNVIYDSDSTIDMINKNYCETDCRIFVTLAHHYPSNPKYTDTIIVVARFKLYINAPKTQFDLINKMGVHFINNRSFVANINNNETLCWIVDEGGHYINNGSVWYEWGIGVMA